MDWDKNGTISCVEFKSYLQKMNGGDSYLDHREVVKAFNQIDQDGSKQVEWPEFYVRKFDLCFDNKAEFTCLPNRFVMAL